MHRISSPLWITPVFFVLSASVFAVEIPDPCGNLLAELDRPTVSDSACVVPTGDVIVESGFQHQYLRDSGSLNLYQSAELRFGLPLNNELFLILPDYNNQNSPDASGFSASSIGLKHEIGYTALILGSVEAVVTTGTGSDAFGSDEYGLAVNILTTFTLPASFGLSLDIGASTETEPKDAGGNRYNSVNPDIVLSYQPKDVFQVYLEVYGQTKTGHDQTSGYNADFGLQYLPLECLELDIEYGHRLSGTLGEYQDYVGAGFGIWF